MQAPTSALNQAQSQKKRYEFIPGAATGTAFSKKGAAETYTSATL